MGEQLAQAAAKLQEVATEVQAIDLTQEKEEVATFLNAAAEALLSLSTALQGLSSRTGDEEAPPEA